MTITELAAWLDSEVQRIEQTRTRFAAAKRPMKLTRGQEIELTVLQTVRKKIDEPEASDDGTTA